MEEVHGGPRIVECSMAGLMGQSESCGEFAQFEARDFIVEEAAGQGEGVEALVAEHRSTTPPDGGVEEAHVETDVVANDDTAADEVEKGGEHLIDGWSVDDHHLGDAGDNGDLRRNSATRIHHCLERPNDFAPADFDRSDFGDLIGLGAAAGRFEVENAERCLGQRYAETVQRLLQHLPGGRLGGWGERHRCKLPEHVFDRKTLADVGRSDANAGGSTAGWQKHRWLESSVQGQFGGDGQLLETRQFRDNRNCY